MSNSIQRRRAGVLVALVAVLIGSMTARGVSANVRSVDAVLLMATGALAGAALVALVLAFRART